LTLQAGLVCVGSANNTSYTFSIPNNISTTVSNNIASFNNINVYQGTFLKKQFRVDGSLDQKFILNNSYIDTSTINATTAIIPTAYISSLNASTINVSTFVAQLISTPLVNVSSIQMGSFGNIIDVTGPLRFTTGSTINFYASSIMANGLQLGTTSNTTIFFDGPSGTYDRTTISESALTGTNQELLLFKGNTTTDQIRAQTTGNIVLEAGVSSRTWPTATQGANPSLYMLGTSAPGQTQVAINTVPTLGSGITFDVASQQTGGGLIRAPVISTTQIYTSTITATLFPVYYNTIISNIIFKLLFIRMFLLEFIEV
jgi:hypothetical protein